MECKCNLQLDPCCSLPDEVACRARSQIVAEHGGCCVGYCLLQQQNSERWRTPGMVISQAQRVHELGMPTMGGAFIGRLIPWRLHFSNSIVSAYGL